MAFFQKIIDEFDGSDELAQAEREALEALEGMAQAKADLFAKKINLLIIDAGEGSNKTVPISNYMRAEGEARAYSSKNAKEIPNIIEDAVGDFIEGSGGSIVSGIFKILAKAVEVFLGATEGRAESISKYFVYATDFAIYRVDLMLWARYVTASSLKTKIEQATAYSFVISNVDIEKISWSDFVAIFSFQLEETTSLTKEQREEARARMLETWNFLKGPAGVDIATLEDGVMTSYEKITAKYILPIESQKSY